MGGDAEVDTRTGSGADEEEATIDSSSLSSSCMTSSVRALTTDNHPRPDLTSTSSQSHGRDASSKVCDVRHSVESIFVG